ncbi:hypothetical protein ACWA7J_15210 [Leptothrix sp. BB-4]
MSTTPIKAATAGTTRIATPTLRLASDSGSSSTDGITNGKTINVDGLQAGASWEYSLDGGSTWITGTRNYFDLPATVIDTGKVYAKDAVQVRQTDATGTSAIGKNSAAWTFDTRIATPTLSLASDTGSSSTDGITKSRTVNVGGLEAGASWQYSQDGGSTWKTGSGSSFELSADKTKRLKLADVTASSVAATLGGGWVESREAATLTDFRVVGATKTAWMIVEDVGYTKGVKLEFSSDASGNLQVMAVDAAFAWGSHIRDWTSTRLTTTVMTNSDSTAGYGIQALKIGDVAVAGSGYLAGYWSYSVDGLTDAPEGTTYTYAVRQTDAAGNVATSTLKTYTLDPRIATPTLSLATDSGKSSTDGITNKKTVNVGGLEAGAAWQYSLDSGGTWKTGSGSSFELNDDVRKMRLSDVTASSVEARLGGGWTSSRAFGVAADFRVVGATKTVWMLVECMGNTQGVKLEFSDDASGRLQVKAVAAASAVDLHFSDWASARQWPTKLADNEAADGLGIWSVKVAGLSVASDGYLAGARNYTVDGMFISTESTTCLVRQTDTAGNTATSAAAKYTLDTAIGTPTFSLANDTGSSNTDRITNANGVKVSGLDSGTNWQYQVDGGTWTTLGKLRLADLKAEHIRGVVDGAIWLAPQPATATDLRTVGSIKTVWMVVEEKGSLKGVKLEFSEDAGGHLQVKAIDAAVAGGTVVSEWSSLYQTTMPLGFSDDAAGYGVKAIQIGTASVANGNYLKADSHTAVDTLNLLLTEGTHSYAVRQTDTAGNTATSATASYTLDNTAPARVSLSAVNIRWTDGVSFGEILNPYIDVNGLTPGRAWEYSIDDGNSWNTGSGKTFDLPRKNLLQNGDFNDGYNKFTTNYAKGVMRPGGILQTTSFNDKGDVWSGQGGDGGGFLYVDGAALGGFWHQRVYMEEGTMYDFSYYRRATVDCRAYGVPTVELTVNWAGKGSSDWRVILPGQKDTFSATGWSRVTRTFTAKASGYSTLALQDTNASGDANDFGIDSISLAKHAFWEGLARVRETDAAGNETITRSPTITPIALDLDASGAIETVGLAHSAGTFDLKNDGQAVHSAWIGKGDAWLAADDNGNGKIDRLDELFGGLGARDAFIKLAGYDSNGDGVVDAADAGFGQLRIWRDANGDHQSQPDELLTLLAAGVKSLKVRADTQHWTVDAQGVTHGDTATATLANGREVVLTDLWLPTGASDPVAAQLAVPAVLPFPELQPVPSAVLA